MYIGYTAQMLLNYYLLKELDQSLPLSITSEYLMHLLYFTFLLQGPNQCGPMHVSTAAHFILLTSPRAKEEILEDQQKNILKFKSIIAICMFRFPTWKF